MRGSLLLAVVASALLCWNSQAAANANDRQPSRNQGLDYGSYEASVRRCKLQQDDVLRTCNSLQLAQRGETGLRIRFTGSGQEPGTTIQYTFITKNPEGIRPLKCDKGRCQLFDHAWIAKVISASTAQFNARGLPVSLPQARAMQGDCRIADKIISCNSQTRQGRILRAEAKL